MINAKVKTFLDNNGLGDRLTEHSETIDTVEHAKDGRVSNEVYPYKRYN